MSAQVANTLVLNQTDNVLNPLSSTKTNEVKPLWDTEKDVTDGERTGRRVAVLFGTEMGGVFESPVPIFAQYLPTGTGTTPVTGMETGNAYENRLRILM